MLAVRRGCIATIAVFRRPFPVTSRDFLLHEPFACRVGQSFFLRCVCSCHLVGHLLVRPVVPRLRRIPPAV